MFEYIRNNTKSWTVKIIFGIIIFVFSFWGVGNMGNSNQSVVAMMDGEAITIQELNQAEFRQQNLIKAQIPSLSDKDLKSIVQRSQVFQSLITTKLLEQEAKRLGIVVTQAELLKEASKNSVFLNSKGQFDSELYKKILAANNTTPAAFETDISKEIIKTKLRSYIGMSAKIDPRSIKERFTLASEKRSARYVLFKTSDYTNAVTVSDEEMQDYYAKNITKFAVPHQIKLEYLDLSPKALVGNIELSDADVQAEYDNNKDTKYLVSEAVKAKHIILSLAEDAEPKLVAEVQEKMQNILAELKAGKSFEALAKANSQDGSAAEGGELGWIEKGQTVPPFEEALFALKTGELSKIVKTQFGLHLIKAEEHRKAGVQEFNAIKGEIKEALALEKSNDYMFDLHGKASAALENGLTLEQIAADLKLKTQATALATKEELAAKLGLKAEELEQLDELSSDSPLSLRPIKTNTGYVVLFLTESKAAHNAPFESVSKDIKDSLISEGGAKLAMKDAEKAADLFVGEEVPASFSKKVLETEAIRRDMQFTGLLGSPTLVEQIFQANDKVWLAKPMIVNDGVVIAALGKITPLSQEEWDKAAEQVILAAEEETRKFAFVVYLEELLRLHPVEIVNPQALNSI